MNAGMRVDRVAVLAAATVLLGTAVALVAPIAPIAPVAHVAPAAAQAGCQNEVNVQTCGANAGHGGGTVDLTGEVAPHVHAGVKKCLSGNPGRWIDYGPPFPGNDDFDPGPPPEPGARYWVFVCPNHINGILNPVNWEGGGWGITPPEQPPTADDVLPALWEAVQARLHDPQVSLDPDEGDDSILHVPTFVEIVNPQVATTYTATATNTAGSVTVSIEVVPTTTLNPGEPGADPVPCDADGTAFDPDGASPDAQAEAAGGSCIYTYNHRNAAGWGGNVTITWAVRWFSNQAGQAGVLDAAPSVQGFDRVVDEVVTVVVDVADG
jgi:hypothetical protein